MVKSVAPRTGTQTVERATRLLFEVARRSTGWRLTELARATGLDLATAHRLLKGLAERGLVMRRDSDRHFLPGPELFNLGLAATYHTEFVDGARALAADLATATRLVAFVFLRSGDDFVCVARSGRNTLLGLTIRTGTRRPLASSAGGVAMLVTMPAAERKRVLAENLARLSSIGELRQRAVERMVQRSLRAGYGLNTSDVVPGITAVGVAVDLPAPWGQGSVLLSGAESAVPEKAVPALVERLRAAADALAGLAGPQG